MINPQESRELIRRTFENDFDRSRFQTFIDRLLKNADFSKQFTQAGNRVFKVSQDKVVSFEGIAQFTDVDGNKIDILIINLRRESTIERARTSLRNFAAEYLKSERGIGTAAVLAAYAVKDAYGGYLPRTEWRFSFVTLETELVKQESGKFKEAISRLTPAKRFSFLVGYGERTHTAQKQFVDLIQSQSAPTLKQIEEAFSVEKVTKDFYDEYERLFKRVKEEINTLRKDRSLDKYFEDNFIETADFAKKLLGQIVFLYFLQRKGWFGVPPDGKWGDGDKRYLRKLFNDRHQIAQSYVSYKRRSSSFFHNVLEPLFYEALAYKHPNDVYSPFNAKVPFLNGGLFESSYEYKKVFIDLPDELFSNRDLVKAEEDADGILDIFDRYNFTVNEAEKLEKDVAIDPEMLGHVFENLLVKEKRGYSGTYYTPQVIVSYMCRQSLLNYLATQLLDPNEQLDANHQRLTFADLKDFLLYADVYGEHEASPTVTHEDKQFPISIRNSAADIDRLLAEVKICDPAIGSGAFPVGLLHEIVRLRCSLVPVWKGKSEDELKRNYSTYALKRHAIENSIYGVDIDQGAVDIARLRLWLSLIVDEDDLKDDKALPNLDYKIMQGNSLLDEYGGLPLIPPDFVRRETPQSITTLGADKALLQRLSNEYVEEGLRSSKRSMKAVHLLRDIENIKRRIEKNTAKPKESELQSNLLEARTQTAIILDELNRIHLRIIDEKDKAVKNELRREAESLLLKYINTYLNERESNIKTRIDSTEAKLEGEVANVRRTLKKDAETVEVARLRRLLSAQEQELKEFVRKRVELKKFWALNKRSHGADTDLTKIEIPENITLRTKPFFLWELQFGDVFRRQGVTDPSQQGFDIVIANPPYGASILPDEKEILKKKFGHIAERIPNSFLYFVGQSYELVRLAGAVCLILPNEFLFQIYMTKARRFFLDNARFIFALNVGEDVFDAIVPVCIIAFQKRQESSYIIPVLDLRETALEDLERRLDSETFIGLPSDIIKSTPNHVFTFDIEKTALVDRITRISTAFEEVCIDIANGISTSCDSVYIVNKEEVKQKGYERKYVKPCLRGGEIRQYFCPSNPEDYVLYITKDFQPEKAEKIFAYLKRNKRLLIDKSVEKKNGMREWHILFRPRNEELFESPKILFRQTGDSVVAALDVSVGYYCIDSINIAKLKEEFISGAKFYLGVLNSNLVNFYYREISQEAGRVLAQVKPQRLRALPIPQAEDWQKILIETLVDYLIFLSEPDSTRNKLMINYFQSIVDSLVYELFFPEELHAGGKTFFDHLTNESLPTLQKNRTDAFQVLTSVFERLSFRSHPIRRSLQFLNEIEVVRIIEGAE